MTFGRLMTWRYLITFSWTSAKVEIWLKYPAKCKDKYINTDQIISILHLEWNVMSVTAAPWRKGTRCDAYSLGQPAIGSLTKETSNHVFDLQRYVRSRTRIQTRNSLQSPFSFICAFHQARLCSAGKPSVLLCTAMNSGCTEPPPLNSSQTSSTAS